MRVKSVATGMSAPLSAPEPLEQRAVVVAERADVELHDQAVVDAHAGKLDQHVAGEPAGVVGRRLAPQGAREDRLGLRWLERCSPGRLDPVVGRDRAIGAEERPALLEGGDERRRSRDLPADDGRERVEVGPPARRAEVDDPVGTERRAHVAGPARGADRGVEGERVGRVVGGAQRLDAKPLEQRARPEGRRCELGAELVVDCHGGVAAQPFGDTEHVTQLVSQPDAGRRAPEQVDVVRERLPGLPVVHVDGASVGSGHAEHLQRDTLGVQHPEDVVVGDDEQLGRRAERRVGVGEQPRIHMPVRAHDRQVRDPVVEIPGNASLRRVGGEEPVG